MKWAADYVCCDTQGHVWSDALEITNGPAWIWTHDIVRYSSVCLKSFVLISIVFAGCNVEDKIFMVKMNWQQAGKRNRRRRQRKAYLNEKLYPSTPLYPSKDMRLFTLHVQKAVAKILESQGFPVKASGKLFMSDNSCQPLDTSK